MTRHGRNATASSVYSYHERQKDVQQSGYGSAQMRLSKDSVKGFDCCSLNLQPCKDPVVSPQGFLFDKQAILEYIVHHKRDFAKKMKAYEKQKNRQQDELRELGEEKERDDVAKFIKQESGIISKHPFKGTQPSSNDGANVASTSTSESISNIKEGRQKELPSFWVANLTPSSKPTLLKKPESIIYCPMSGKPLKFKDLMPVKFTLIKDKDDTRASIVKDARYMCAVTHDIITDSIPCAVLKPSGAVVTMECVEKLIKKDMLDPICGKLMKESDIIPLQRGGTGFSATGTKLDAKLPRPVLQA